jgi:hypothetical protein
VVSDLLAGRSEMGAVYVAYMDTFPSAFELEVLAMTTTADHGFGRDVFGRHWPLVGERRDEIPPQLLRVGVQFADGRKATNITGHDRPAAGPTMWPLRGGSSGRRLYQGYWVSPLPTSGSVALVCEWPAAGIQLVHHEVDGQLILDGARAGSSDLS